jgi:hypothetical protein
MLRSPSNFHKLVIQFGYHTRKKHSRELGKVYLQDSLVFHGTCTRRYAHKGIELAHSSLDKFHPVPLCKDLHGMFEDRDDCIQETDQSKAAHKTA